jgi:deoxyribodipyrimidine photolyase-related protein
MSNTTLAVVIWGTQLTIDNHSALQAYPDAPVIIIESKAMCRRFKYHKQKLAFVLTAMREYADELRAAGRTVHYIQLEDSDDWFKSLDALRKKFGITTLAAMRQNDRTPQRRLETWCEQQGIRLEITPNQMFLTSTALFNEWAEEHKMLRMEQFYRWQRQRLGILMQENGKPEGGRWNYDSDNRKPLPKDAVLPDITFPKASRHRANVLKIIDGYFADHPGNADTNWLPTTRQQARDWLQQFIDQRFDHFGDYEDAMLKGQTFLHHSAISALLNIGLLHPQEVVDAALAADVPLASKEGFIRQIIGWREFVFGLYHYKPATWSDENFFEHQQTLPDWWWQLDGSVEAPLDDVLSRLKQYGYSHHIERLMVLGNYMLLAQYDPREVYRWFMTMYVDAYEWVMVPNIIGMSQYADGGIEHGGFATKPYISGSNYLQKMGKWWPSTAASKDSEWTQMYWEFLAQHEDALSNNFRLRPLFNAARRNTSRQ